MLNGGMEVMRVLGSEQIKDALYIPQYFRTLCMRGEQRKGQRRRKRRGEAERVDARGHNA